MYITMINGVLSIDFYVFHNILGLTAWREGGQQRAGMPLEMNVNICYHVSGDGVCNYFYYEAVAKPETRSFAMNGKPEVCQPCGVREYNMEARESADPSALLERLRGSIAPAERAALERGEGLVISRHNRETLLRMLTTDPSPDGRRVDPAVLSAMEATLQGYLDRYMPDRPEGHKWIMLSCVYLAFVAREPLHPRETVGWVQREDGYHCPARETTADSLCRWCACGGEA